MRSRVTPNSLPTSSSVRTCPSSRPKRNRTIRKIQGSDAYEAAMDKVHEATSVASDKVRDVMSHTDDGRAPTLPDPWPETARP